MKKMHLKTFIFATLIMVGASISVGSIINNSADYTEQAIKQAVASSNVLNTDDDVTSPSDSAYSTVDDLLYPSTPDGFASIADPYGFKGNKKSTIVDPLNELIEFYGTDFTYYSGYTRESQTMFQQLDVQYQYTSLNSLSNSSTSLTGSDKLDSFLDGLSCIKVEPFDPTGTGRDDFLAFLGVGAKNDTLELMIYEIATNTVRTLITLDASLPFLKYSASRGNAIVKNFFDITHGDYDDDGIDTLVVFTSIQPNSNHDSLYEYEFNNNASSSSNRLKLIKYSKTKLVHKLYCETDVLSIPKYENTKTKYFLRGDIETGDINSDGIDDLLMSSNAIYEKYFSTNCNPMLAASYVSMTLGSESKQSILDSDSSDAGMYLYQDNSAMGEPDIITYNAGVTVGNIDANGYNSIVTGGVNFCFYPENNNAMYVQASYGVYKIRYLKDNFKYSYDNSLFHDALGNFYTNPYDAFSYQNYQIKAFSYLGLGYEDALYMNGYVFTLKNTKKPTILSQLSKEITPIDLSNTRQGVDKSYRYVDNITIGNFNNTYGGYEQVVATIGYCDYYLTDSTFYVTTEIVGYFGTKDNMKLNKSVQTTVKQLNQAQNFYAIVSCDCDDDGALIRYNTKAYYYSDVSPLAVLQAAPYFQELYDNDHYNLQDSGDTSLTIAYKQGSAYGEKSSSETQLGVYCTESAIVETVDMTTGETDYFEEGWEDSMSFEVSESFHSGSVDTVVVYQTPLIFYIYDVYDADTRTWVEGDYVIYVEGKPLFSQLTVTEYNNYVRLYKSLVSTSDYNLSDPNIVELNMSLLEDNEGDPFSYNVCDPIGESFLLGHDGGYSSYRYAIETESSSYTEKSYGTYYNLSAGAGFSAFGCGAYIGVNYALNEMSGSKTTTVSGKRIEVEAIVGDIRGFAFEAQGYDLSLSRQYGFTWRLATYDTGIKTSGLGGTTNLMVYSYSVSDIYQPVGAPTLTSCEYSNNVENEVVITWDPPAHNGVSSVKGYNVYTYETINGVSEVTHKINNTLIDASETSYSFIVTNSKWQRFFVRAVTDDKNETEGLRSNEGTASSDVGIAISAAKYVTTTSENGNKYYVYKIAYNDTTIYDEVYFKASNDDNGVCKDTSAFFVAKNHGFKKDYQTYLMTIDCLCSYTNHLYSKGNVASISKCEGPTIVSSICAICGQAHNEVIEEGGGHHYHDVVVEATCSEQGYTMHVCDECGDSYKDNYTSCSEHSFITKVIAPTRFEEGYTVHKCSDCPYYYKDNFVEKLQYNEFYSGHGVPSSSLGLDGDSYVDNDTYDFYEKESGNWVITGSIKGKDGVSVKSIAKTSSEGLVDTYTITYSDGKTSTFTVTNGQDGVTPTISINAEGYWVINNVTTDIKALGEDGKNGATPSISISEDGYWEIDGVKTTTKAEGNNGIDANTPYVGDSGNWCVNNFDTGIRAVAQNNEITSIDMTASEGNVKTYKATFTGGETKMFDIEGGDTSNAPYVGDNGNWYINCSDSGVKAVDDSLIATKFELLTADENGTTYAVTYSDGTQTHVILNPRLDGATAKMVFKGTGVPSSTFGEDDFVYVDTTNWIAYRKSDGEWNKIADLKEYVASSMYVHDGYWYIGSFKTPLQAEGNEGKQVKTVTKTTTEEGRYNFHVVFTDNSEYDYLAPEGFKPLTLTTGLSNPVNNLGNESDVYLNLKTMNFYRKINGAWTLQGCLNERIFNITNIEQTAVYDDSCVYTVTYSDNTNSQFVINDCKNVVVPTVSIDKNGYWQIDGTSTSVLALGSDGKNNGAIIAPSNGNWSINGVDTGINVITKSTGCGGSVVAASATISSLALAGAILLIAKRRKTK